MASTVAARARLSKVQTDQALSLAGRDHQPEWQGRGLVPTAYIVSFSHVQMSVIRPIEAMNSRNYLGLSRDDDA